MIQIDKKYFIEADEYSINAYKYTGKISDKTGEKIKKNIGYYPTLESAIEACRKDAIQSHVAEKKAESLAEAVKEVKKITKHFEELLQEYCNEP